MHARTYGMQALLGVLGALHGAGAYQIVTSRAEVEQRGHGAAPAHLSWHLGSIPMEGAKAMLMADCGALSGADAEAIAAALDRNALLLRLVGASLRDSSNHGPGVAPFWLRCGVRLRRLLSAWQSSVVWAAH